MLSFVRTHKRQDEQGKARLSMPSRAKARMLGELIVAAGEARIDNPKFKAMFHAKAKMLSADEAEPLIGHAVGGVCPFGVNEGCDVYLDSSLKRFRTVFPACGSANSAVELSLEELERAAAPCAWVDVCKLPEQR